MDLFSDSESPSSSVSVSRRSETPPIDIIEHGQGCRDEAASFRINKEYAERFQHNNERAEVQRLEEKHKYDVEGANDSSDSESEDEYGEQMTADVDAAILTTLAKIRRKDESIYEVGKRVFEEERALAASKPSLPKLGRALKDKAGKSVTLGQYQRERIQDLLATSNDPARELADATMIEKRSDEVDYDKGRIVKTFADEEEYLRREVTTAFHEMADESSELFTRRNTDGLNDEDDTDESYRRYLTQAMGGSESELRSLLSSQMNDAVEGPSTPRSLQVTSRSHRTQEKEKKAQDDEQFLANYILNRGWLDKDNKSKGGRERSIDVGGDDLRDDQQEEEIDDEFDSRAEAFESAYNYRFQDLEEGKVNPQIQSYSRHIQGSVRRQDNKRKTDREERKRRKAAELEQKRAELDRLRDLKRKSISDRLAKLKEVTGSAAINFEGFALDDEFDPEKHDRAMAAAFDERYYGDTSFDRRKPVFDEDGEKQYGNFAGEDLLHEDDDHDGRYGTQNAAEVRTKLSKAEKKKMKKREKAVEARKASASGDGVGVDEMDAEADVDSTQHAQEIADLTPSERKRKMEEMMDEYYGLDYEDVVADQPTRFRYTEVPKSDFGLSATEILMADDADLNKVIGIKRLQPYRRGNSKKGPADLKARLNEFRRKFDGSKTRGTTEGVSQGGDRTVKKAGKRERERKKAAAARAQTS